MLFIDSREPYLVQATVANVVGVQSTHLMMLESADFMMIDQCSEGVAHSIGIERKTVSDLLNSASSGRLERQLSRMVERYSHPILLVEGRMRMDDDGFVVAYSGTQARGRETKWKHAAIQAILLSFQLRLKVPLIWTGGLSETVDILRVLHARGEKGCFDGSTVGNAKRASRAAGARASRRKVDPGHSLPVAG